MPRKENSKPYAVEVQKGPISMNEQYSEQFRKEPEHLINDMKNLEMRQDKMRLTLHTPKK